MQLLSLLVTLVLQSLSNILPSYTNGNYFLYWRHPRHLIFNKHINYVKAKLHIHRILLKVLHQACWEKTEAEHLCENRKREDLEKTVTGIVCKTLLNCRTITSTLSAGRWDIDAGWSSRLCDVFVFVVLCCPARLQWNVRCISRILASPLQGEPSSKLMQYGSPLLWAETGVMVSLYWSLLFFSIYLLFFCAGLSLPCFGTVPLRTFILAPGEAGRD